MGLQNMQLKQFLLPTLCVESTFCHNTARERDRMLRRIAIKSVLV